MCALNTTALRVGRIVGCALVLLSFVLPERAGALDDLRGYAYVRTDSPSVILIDIKSDKAVREIRFEDKPRAIYVIEDEKLLLSVSTGGRQIEVYDLAAGRMVSPLYVGSQIGLFQYSAKSGVVAVADVDAGRITLVDLRRRAILGKVEGFDGISSIGFDRTGDELLVTRRSSPSVSVIDVRNPQAVQAFSIKPEGQQGDRISGLRSLDKTPNGRFALAIAENSPNVSVVDLGAKDVVKDIRIGKGAFDRAYSTGDGAFILLSSDRNQSVSLVSMASQSEVASFHVGPRIANISTAWFETTAFAVDQAESNIVILDLVSRKVTSVIHLPGHLGKSAVTPDGVRVFIPSRDTRSIAVIDARTNRLSGMITELNFAPEEVIMAGSIAFCH
jgi:DNA-binding beta-propeller fold protein YncE